MIAYDTFFSEQAQTEISNIPYEITNILIHLTDPSQNKEFHDKYFSGIDFDLSKAIIIFSYNDSSKIDKILLDRITEIQVDPLSLPEKLVICEEFLLPEIFDNVGISRNEVILSQSLLHDIIDLYTNEAGVRKIKEILYTIIRHINYEYFNEDLSLPFIINKEYVTNILKENHKNNFVNIPESPCIGKINGLYASTSGVGGITLIEVYFTPNKNFLELELTGNQGTVMKESMQCAKTLIWNILSPQEQESINRNGLHIHCPAAAIAKDGPSAGCAIAIAIYSRILNKLIKHDIAITGEIDLNGYVHAVGGIDAKIFGAIRAGVKTILIPTGNENELNNFLDKNKDLDVNIILINSINDAIKHFIIN